MVTTALLVAALVGAVVFDLDPRQEPAPQVEVSHALVEDGPEQSIAVTVEAGDAVRRAGAPEGTPSGGCPTYAEERRARDESVVAHTPPEAARLHILRGPYRLVVGT